MKSFRLVSALRTLFGVSRILLLIGAVLSPMYFFPISNRLETTVTVSPNEFRLAHDYHAAGVAVNLRQLEAAVTIDDQDGALPELASLRRRTTGPATMLRFAFSLLICDLLWRLLRNLEGGAIFNPANIRYVRWLGIIMIVGSIVISTFQAWANTRIGSFIAGHIWFDGVHRSGAPADSEVKVHIGTLIKNTEFNTGFILTGLAILVLAEVFRQGLNLKQDAELTV